MRKLGMWVANALGIAGLLLVAAVEECEARARARRDRD